MEKKIRVLHLSSEKTWRGGEQQIAYLIEEHSGSGVESFAAVRKNSEFEQYALRKGFNFFSLPFANSFDIRSALALKRICGQNQISLVHMHSSKAHGIGVMSAILGNRSVLLLSRRVDFVPKNNFLTKWKYNHPSIKRIVCVSDKINQTMRAFVKRPERCVTIHSGVDLLKFDPKNSSTSLQDELNLLPGTILIGNTSALDAHKDYFTFIDTIAILLQKNHPVKGIIIGTGALKSELEKYTADRNLTNDIIFTGFRTDIRKILPSLSIFLMTTRMEGLGTSILDAFLAEVPVVATRAGGIPEMVVHEKTGMLAPIGQAEELAIHCEKIIRDESFRKLLVSQAKEKVRNFSKEKTAEKTLELYRELLSGGVLPGQIEL
jgi:glycosyltransferase involved in cell wall biosynthesis